MDFGFVGSEQECQRLKPQFDAQSAHRLVAVLLDSTSATGTAIESKSQPLAWPAAVRKFSDFEQLLTDADIDALILGASCAAQADRLRRIAQHGRSCLCLPAGESDAILLHEVAMIAADTDAVLIPWLPGRLHPAWKDLLARYTPDILGAAQSVLIERTGRMPIGRPLVAAGYAEAADLLAALASEITEVTATGDPAAGRLVVLHRTATGATGEIRLAPAPSDPHRWRVAIEAQRGNAELTWDQGLDGPATLRWHDERGDHEISLPAPAPDQQVLAEFARAVNFDPLTLDWSDAIRAAELADAAWLSLERRRSVDVFHEKRNELASFKGRMTSLGCGLIWFTLFMLILIAAGKGLQIPGADWLAAVTALVWIVFLGLQALRWVFPAENGSAGR